MTFLEQLFNANLSLTPVAGIAAGQLFLYAPTDQVMRMKMVIQHWPQEQESNTSAS